MQHLPPPSSGGDSLGGSGAANLRVAPYNLNREKQVSKLVSDTRLEDYEIVVSPTEQNINVHCSTGFYSLVVLPAFSEIFVGYTTTTSNISLHCYDITGKVDNSKSNVNTVLFFKLSHPNNSKSNNVTITLHHTVRKVQVQGSSIINNSIRANVWFLQNILVQMFRAKSATKALDISQFNRMVSNVVQNHLQKRNSQAKCTECDILFTSRSQQEQCKSCSNYYHKRCLTGQSHQCVASPRPPTTGLGSPLGPPSTRANISPHPRNTAGHGLLSTTQLGTAAHPHPATTSPSLTPTLSVLNQQAHSSQAPTATSDATLVIVNSSLDPSTTNNALTTSLPATVVTTSVPSVQPSYITTEQPISSGAGGSNTITTTRQPRTRKNAAKHVPPIDKFSFDLECKQKQLSTAHAKIQELEVENTKLSKTNHILGERIKMFENASEKELFEQYFPHKPATLPSNKDSTHPSNVCFPQPCCPPPPCHCYNRCNRGYSTIDHTAEIKELSDKISKALNELNLLKTKIANKNQQASPLDGQPNLLHCSRDVPLSPEVRVVEMDEVQLSPESQNMSTNSANTIDDHVDTNDALNSRFLTSQLPQLVHQNI